MRYFLEVSYRGTGYSGFQSQHNANTIQAEVEKAFKTLQREAVVMTGSSRTDRGVHARQNFFHFDYDEKINPHFLYKINAILPQDIVVEKLIPVSNDAHCRFDAVSREYKYFIYGHKNPFLKDRAFYFPYRLDFSLMQEAAAVIGEYNDFTSFSRRKTQVKTFNCTIYNSEWMKENSCLVFRIKANRFLRGMVRSLTATMLLVGREKLSIHDFRKIIEARDCTLANFAVPGHGLFLMAVEFPTGYFPV